MREARFDSGCSAFAPRAAPPTTSARPTLLLGAYLAKLGTKDPRDFIPAVYRGKWDKAAIAGLAPLVLELAAAGDETAKSIFESETLELARTAVGAVVNGGLPEENVPVALTGGLVLRSEMYRERFLANLRICGMTPGPVGLVEDPALGSGGNGKKADPSHIMTGSVPLDYATRVERGYSPAWSATQAATLAQLRPSPGAKWPSNRSPVAPVSIERLPATPSHVSAARIPAAAAFRASGAMPASSLRDIPSPN